MANCIGNFSEGEGKKRTNPVATLPVELERREKEVHQKKEGPGKIPE